MVVHFYCVFLKILVLSLVLMAYVLFKFLIMFGAILPFAWSMLTPFKIASHFIDKKKLNYTADFLWPISLKSFV